MGPANPELLTPSAHRPRRSKASALIFAAAILCGALAHATPATASTAARTAEPGVTYFNEKIEKGPWSLHVIKVDRAAKDLGFHAGLARGKVLGVSFIAEQARTLPAEIGRAIAGINGDFYERDNRLYAGDPRGLQIVNGDLVSAPSTFSVWFDAEGNPQVGEIKSEFKISWPDGRTMPFGLNQQRRSNLAVLYTPTYGASTRANGSRELILEREGAGPWLPLAANETYRARVRDVATNGNTKLAGDIMVLTLPSVLPGGSLQPTQGMVLEISTATVPELKGVKTAISGGPAIVTNGKPFAHHSPPEGNSNNYSERSKYERHPRSAIGWNATHFFMVTADGRQPGLSVGMKLAELGEYMVKLGCTEAMNLDGGKSAQLWMSGRIVNSPSQGEDTVANSLLLYRKAPSK